MPRFELHHVALLTATALLALPASSPAQVTPGEDQFDALRVRYAAALEFYNSTASKATTLEERKQLVLDRWPGNTMADDFLRLEAQHRGTLVGLSALHHIVSTGGFPTPESRSSLAVRRAFELLTNHYAEDEELDLIFAACKPGRFAEHSKALLRRAAESPHAHIRGTALLNLARVFADESQIVGVLDEEIELLAGVAGELAEFKEQLLESRAGFGEVDVQASRDEALRLLSEVIESYADVLESPRTGVGPILLRVERADPSRRPLRELADSIRFELLNLAIGQPAPEISGPDWSGKDLKLSAQRGKVTVVMFSFKGCGPCEAMYPGNRQLVERYRGRPFALLGVMGDDELATVQQSVEDGTITWPVWWDRRRQGPLATRWNVNSWPQVFVLDHRGVIRYRKLGMSSTLELAVARLLQEAEEDR